MKLNSTKLIEKSQNGNQRALVHSREGTVQLMNEQERYGAKTNVFQRNFKNHKWDFFAEEARYRSIK